MARVIGPLHCLDARGALGKTLIYAKQRGSNYCKKYAVPTGDPTAAQLGHRVGVAYIRNNWARLVAHPELALPDRRPLWQPLADQWNTTPYHAYLRYNMLRWGQNFGPSNTPDALDTINEDQEYYLYIYHESSDPINTVRLCVEMMGTPDRQCCIQAAYAPDIDHANRSTTFMMPTEYTDGGIGAPWYLETPPYVPDPPFTTELYARVCFTNGQTSPWFHPELEA